MKSTIWVQFSWDLAKLPTRPPGIESGYHFGAAKAADREDLENTLIRAYTAERNWSVDLDDRLQKVHLLIRERLSDGTADFLVLRHGNRIIGGSAVIDDPEASEHLASGVCILDEYRCRGLGSYLLYESLQRLKAGGLAHASVLTKNGVAAERFLYPKFGGKRTERVDETAGVA